MNNIFYTKKRISQQLLLHGKTHYLIWSTQSRYITTNFERDTKLKKKKKKVLEMNIEKLFSLSVMANARLHGSYNSQDTVLLPETMSDGCDQRVWDSGSPLYDTYELVSFAHIIERRLLPFSPLIRPSSLSLRSLMDKDKDDYSSASKTTTSCIQRRKHWWSRKKNEKRKKDIKKKKKKISACISRWSSSYKNLFV